MQTWENWENPNFAPPPSPPQKKFWWVLPLLVVRYSSKLLSYAMSWKTNELTWENCKKPNFRPDFDPFGPNLDP